jgi:hypothetical protein
VGYLETAFTTRMVSLGSLVSNRKTVHCRCFHTNCEELFVEWIAVDTVRKHVLRNVEGTDRFDIRCYYRRPFYIRSWILVMFFTQSLMKRQKLLAQVCIPPRSRKGNRGIAHRGTIIVYCCKFLCAMEIYLNGTTVDHIQEDVRKDLFIVGIDIRRSN